MLLKIECHGGFIPGYVAEIIQPAVEIIRYVASYSLRATAFSLSSSVFARILSFFRSTRMKAYKLI